MGSRSVRNWAGNETCLPARIERPAKQLLHELHVAELTTQLGFQGDAGLSPHRIELGRQLEAQVA